MEERGLKVLNADTTFFSKITTKITKILSPTKVGFNSILINMKRNNILKAYEQYNLMKENGSDEKLEQAKNKYEETYSLYLESIDKYIMDSVYKKVKKGIATSFEKDALTSYYNIVHLKDNEYLEYKYRKQKFLLELDYENIKTTGKDKIVQRFENMYVSKVDSLYKGIIKNYSVKLADSQNSKTGTSIKIYLNIFSILEDYVKNVLILKMEKDEDDEIYEKILPEYHEFEKFTVGKLDEKEIIEKYTILLGLSRVLFTHSLPLAAAEQCYKKLLRDTRSLILNSKNKTKKEDAYGMLLKLVEEYNLKLLSTKVYWDKPQDRVKYKKFWNKFSNCKNSQEKEILILKSEIAQTENKVLLKYYKSKLIDFGVMKTVKGYKNIENKEYDVIKGSSKKKITSKIK